jgi:AraC-like DNA-binding protein
MRLIAQSRFSLVSASDLRYPKSEISTRAPMQALPAFQRLTYSGLEPSQAFDIVYGGHFEHRLLARGRATLDHQRLTLEDIRLETGAYDFPVIARGVMPRDMVCIGLMADGIETTRYNTAAIGADEIQIYPQGVDLLYHAAAASRWINFTVPEARLQEAAVACCGHPLELPRRDAISVRLPRGKRSNLVRLVDDAFAIGRSLGPDGVSPALAREVVRGVLTAYVEALGAAGGGDRRASLVARQHLHLVLACEQLATSASAVDIRLDEIARRSGYSRRALELIFQRSVGAPPGRWFMNMRLNGALRDLLSAAPPCRVADVATRWGFRHLPRFAEQYRRVFGELPSQTLSRAGR